MGLFEDMDDVALAAAITDLTGRITGQPANPAVKSVAGEGRRIEYATASIADLRRLLREAKEERDSRAGGIGGRAIGVRFP
jgi:hypothetical protein